MSDIATKIYSQYIDYDNLSYEQVNIGDLVSHYKEKLDNSNLLIGGSFPKKKVICNGVFDDDTWVIYRSLHKNYRYIEFNKLDNLIFTNITPSQKLLIKCWIAKLLLEEHIEVVNETNNYKKENITSEKATAYFNFLVEFIKSTNNFSKEFLDKTKGDNLEDFLCSTYSQGLVMSRVISSILNYFNFTIFENDIACDFISNDIYAEYQKRLIVLKDSIILSVQEKKDLPSAQNILLFDYYIKKFFDDKKIDKPIKIYYYPLLLWWKITNVIPMRISEFCVKIPRDCLLIEDNNYYLKIDRIKKDIIKEDTSSNKSLPVLTKVKINKEYYDLINTYINETNEFGTTNTLISYKAQSINRELLANNCPLFYSSTIINDNQAKKYNEEYYTYHSFRKILNSFYEKIIKNWYKDTEITQRIRPNDTRHFAFTSLLLQGVPPVEIAILGGHSDLSTLATYTNDVSIYIDSQIFINVNKNLSSHTLNKNTIYDVIFNQPKECPVLDEDCVETEFDGIYLGVCMATSDDDCENYDCYSCSKWYCKPTRDNYYTLCKIAQKQLNEQQNTLQNNVNFFNKLLLNSALLYSENAEIEVSLERNYFTEMKNFSKQIQSTTNEVIKLKSSFLNGMLKDKDYTKLEVIEKLNILHSLFDADTKYL